MPFISIKEIPYVEMIPGYKVRFVHSDHLTIAYWKIDAWAPLPEHRHHQEQIAHVTNGKFELTMEWETKVLKYGENAIIPSNVLHSWKAITDCEIIDVFSPVRDEYREKYKDNSWILWNNT